MFKEKVCDKEIRAKGRFGSTVSVQQVVSYVRSNRKNCGRA